MTHPNSSSAEPAGGPLPSNVSVAPTADGCLVRVEGRGTVRESRVVKDLITRTLRDDRAARVTLDIATCTYVDSTFLGCLMDLHRVAGADGADAARLIVAAPAEQRKKLLGIARLDKLLSGQDAPPMTIGPLVPVPASAATPREILRHVMECHQQLAEVDCPMRPVFARIAAQVRKELEASEGKDA